MAKTIKNGFIDEDTTFPVNVWIPANNKHVRIFSITGFILNRVAAKDVILKIQIDIDGGLKDIAVIGIRGEAFQNIVVPIPHDLETDIGDGTAPAIKLIELGASNSTDWDGFFAVIGEEV